MTQTVGELIRESRESLGLSQREFVTKVNRMFNNSRGNTLSRRHLSNIELGNTGVSINKLNLITFGLMKLGSQ